MITKEQAFTTLVDVIREKKVHQDYDRVCEYSKLHRIFITGENADTLLKQFTYRENDTLFSQRTTITQHTLKPCAATAMKPLFKIPRVTPVINMITYEKPDANREKELKTMMDTFYNGQSIDTYLEEQFPTRSGYDPNSFFLALFNEFDFRFERPKPYITEVNAEQAIYFEYFNNELQLLVVRTEIDIALKEGGTRAGYMYQIYIADWAYEFTQVDDSQYVGGDMNSLTDFVIRSGDEAGQTGQFYKFDTTRVFRVKEFNTKSGVIPAVRVGSVPDPATDGRTRVGILDNAEPYFMKTVKAVSELDLTMSLHVFPQKVVYAPRCVACNKGTAKDGSICTVCNGTMRQASHTSAQETVELPLPDERNLDKMLDLSKLVYYVTVPVEGMKFQNDYVDALGEKIIKAIYNSDTFLKDTVVETAFKQRIGMESVYDTLQPYGTNYGVIRTHLTKVFANYMDLGQGLVVKFSFPKDFKFKPLGVLLSELSNANTSQAPSFVKDEINNDIRNMLYQDRPRDLKRLKVQDDFYPFSGKTEQEIEFAFAQRNVLKSTEILYSNFKDIFTSVERDAELKNQDFYEYTYEIQKQKIEEKINIIADKLKGEQQVTIPFPKPPANASVGDPITEAA